MDDCNALWFMAHPGMAPPNPMPLFVGYLVILSPNKFNLDVTAVYTSNPPRPAAGGDILSNSIDVERVDPKRIYHP